MEESSEEGQLATVLADWPPPQRCLILRGPESVKQAEVESLLLKSDAVLVATRDAYRERWQAEVVCQALVSGRPAVVVALGGPYDLLAFPEAPCYLAAYKDQPCLLRALGEVLFGLLAPSGRLPVPLPGLYPIGHALPRPEMKPVA